MVLIPKNPMKFLHGPKLLPRTSNDLKMIPKMTPKEIQMTPKGPQMSPKGSQMSSKLSQGCLTCTQMTPEGPQMTPQ